MPADADAAFWAEVLAEAGAPHPGPPAEAVTLAEVAGDELTLLRLFLAVEDRLPGGFAADLLDVLDTFGDLAHFVAVRRSHTDAGRPGRAGEVGHARR